MRKRKIVICSIVIIVILTAFFGVPIKYKALDGSEKGTMLISINEPHFNYEESNGEVEINSDIVMKAYTIPELENMELKEKIIGMLEETKYFRTPVTVVKNITKNSSFEQCEKIMWIIIGKNDIYIADKYIIVNQKIYSLGYGGEQKSQELIERIEEVMEKEGAEYLE